MYSLSEMKKPCWAWQKKIFSLFFPSPLRFFSMMCREIFSVEYFYSDVFFSLCVNKAFILCRCVSDRGLGKWFFVFRFLIRSESFPCWIPAIANTVKDRRWIETRFFRLVSQSCWIKYDWRPPKHCFLLLISFKFFARGKTFLVLHVYKGARK